MIYDIAIIGAGMAGASLAAELDPRSRVVLIEAEEQPGYHATGRSAAFWDQSYGGPDVLPLTNASHSFLANPPAAFSERGFLSPRGVLYIAQEHDAQRLETFVADFLSRDVELQLVGRNQLETFVGGLSPAWTMGAWGKDCCDIDVAALHQAYLAKAKRNGIHLASRARVRAITPDSGHWRIAAGGSLIEARRVVNAAGAWADDVATMAGLGGLGHAALRRTMLQLRCAAPIAESVPLTFDFGGKFYFKPASAGRLWLSPHDEVPSPPCDAAAEEIDVARAIDALGQCVDWSIKAIERKWAGLRTFAPDRKPVYGFDPRNPSFFWCTGQGGFGIQTAPAAARMCAALIDERTPHRDNDGVDPKAYAPDRFLG